MFALSGNFEKISSKFGEKAVAGDSKSAKYCKIESINSVCKNQLQLLSCVISLFAILFNYSVEVYNFSPAGHLRFAKKLYAPCPVFGIGPPLKTLSLTKLWFSS